MGHGQDGMTMEDPCGGCEYYHARTDTPFAMVYSPCTHPRYGRKGRTCPVRMERMMEALDRADGKE